MFAPPGVDSSSSGEDHTPPPSPEAQRIRPKFSFKSLFSPNTEQTIRRSRTPSKHFRRVKPSNEEVKHSTPIEAAEADNFLPTEPISPKKRVRIFAGELEKGQKAKGLTNNLDENVRDSLILCQTQGSSKETQGGEEENMANNNGISEEVLIMLRKLMAEQKEAEQAENDLKDTEKARDDREKLEREEMNRKEFEQAREADEYEAHRRRIEQRELEEHLNSLSDTSPIAISQPAQHISKGLTQSNNDTERSTDIIEKIRSGASLTKKKSLKSLKSLRIGGRGKKNDPPPVPPIPQDTSFDDGCGKIYKTPIADKFAKPLPELFERSGPYEIRTAPPGITNFDPHFYSPEKGQGYYLQHPVSTLNGVYHTNNHQTITSPPQTAPPIPAYHCVSPALPTSMMQKDQWCQPPGLPIHAYHPVSPTPIQSPPVSTPLPYIYASDRSPTSTLDRTRRKPYETSTCPQVSGAPLQSPHLKDGPGKQVKRQTAQTFDSHHGEIEQMLKKDKQRMIETDVFDPNADSQSTKYEGVDTTKTSDSKAESAEDNYHSSDNVQKTTEKVQEDSAIPSAGTSMDPLFSREHLEKSVNQYKAKYAEAMKVYKSFNSDESSKAKERLRAFEHKLKQSIRLLEEYPDGESQTKLSGVNGTQHPESVNRKVESGLPEEIKSPSSLKLMDQKASYEYDIKRYQARLAQLKKAYSKKGLKGEEKQDIKLRLRSDEMKLKEVIKALKKLELQDNGEALEVTAENENGNQLQERERSVVTQGKGSKKEDQHVAKPKESHTDEMKNDNFAGNRNQVVELKQIVERYQQRYKQAIRVCKTEGLSEENKKEAKQEVKTSEAKLRQAMKALEEANESQDVAAIAERADEKQTGKRQEEANDKGLTGKQQELTHSKESIEKIPALNDIAQAKRGLEKEAYSEDSGEHGSLESAAEVGSEENNGTNFTEINRKEQAQKATETSAVDNQSYDGHAQNKQEAQVGPASEKDKPSTKLFELEKAIKHYQIRHKKASEAYNLGNISDEKKTELKEEIKKIEDRLRSSRRALHKIKEVEEPPARDMNKGDEVKADVLDTEMKPPIHGKNQSTAETQDELKKKQPDLRDKSSEQKLKEAEEAVKVYKRSYEEAVSRLQAEDLSREQVKELSEMAKQAESRLQEAKRILEDMKRQDDKVDQKKIVIENEAKGPAKASSNDDTNTSAKARPKQEELEAQLQKYIAQHTQAIGMCKQPNLSEAERKKAKEKVILSEMKIRAVKEKLQSLQHEDGDLESKVQKSQELSNLDQSPEVDEKINIPSLQADNRTAGHEGSHRDIEEKLIRLKAQLSENTRIYKSGKLSEDDKKTIKQKILSLQIQIENTTKQLKRLKSSDSHIDSEQKPTTDKAGETDISTKSTIANDTKKIEERIKKYKEAYISTAKVLETNELSDEDTKKANEKLKMIEYSLNEAQEELEVSRGENHNGIGNSTTPKSTSNNEAVILEELKSEYSRLKSQLVSPDTPHADKEKIQKEVDSLKVRIKEFSASGQSGQGKPDAKENGRKLVSRKPLSRETEEGVKTSGKREADAIQGGEVGEQSGLSEERWIQNETRLNVESGHGKVQPQDGTRKEYEEDMSLNGTGNISPWAPLRISQKSLPVQLAPSKSPFRSANMNQLQDIDDGTNHTTWSEILVSLTICIDLGNKILRSIQASENPNPLIKIIQSVITGMILQKDLLASLKEVIEEVNHSALDEINHHIAIIRQYVEKILQMEDDKKIDEKISKEVERSIEKGSHLLQNATVKAIIAYFDEFTEYLTPGMINILLDMAEIWKEEGLGVKMMVDTILATRKEVSNIQNEKVQSKDPKEKRESEIMIGILDKILSLLSIDLLDASRDNTGFGKDGKHKSLKPQLTTMSGSVRKERKDIHDKGESSDCRYPKKHREKPNPLKLYNGLYHTPPSYDHSLSPPDFRSQACFTPRHHFEQSNHKDKPEDPISSLKLYPIAATPSPMARSHTPNEEPPKSLSYLVNKISNKFHRHSHDEKSSKHRKIRKEDTNDSEKIDLSGLKLPKTTENFLKEPYLGKDYRPIMRRGSTSSSFSATIPCDIPSNLPNSVGYIASEESSPSKYSQTTSTTRSDNVADDLLAHADSGPQGVRHDWRNDFDTSTPEKINEIDDNEIERAKDVLYNI
ncbi:uncharacterized protein I206_100094 [Kwoniella pini CBS 10737]|uniref:Uncharacterized protein n=1 Tax=Kwoniella pini CBS 10737 TaxID=1296096 RepID=A0A1B9IEP1_9TREE|nr:uncharacterized protein I206_01234 [Kwoniella pini CBS 10737]OCF53927.1 hypothetical protein I206_01234 [Kwoniella pini CBS 10737]